MFSAVRLCLLVVMRQPRHLHGGAQTVPGLQIAPYLTMLSFQMYSCANAVDYSACHLHFLYFECFGAPVAIAQQTSRTVMGIDCAEACSVTYT